MLEHDQALQDLAKRPARMENVEDEIPHVDEAIKQSDVMDHLKEATKDVQ